MMQQQAHEMLTLLLNAVAKYHPHDQIPLVEKAFIFATQAHAGQMRQSNEPYFAHPYHVAMILADLMLDATTIAAALLHDVVEDTPTPLAQIEREFGSEVALLVDGVTKLTRQEFTTKEEQKAESLRKMVLAMAKDIRVIIIKLADRLHNMRTLQFVPPQKQLAVAQETMDIYAPLAHRLGMSGLKWELEDLCLRYLEPEVYTDLVKRVGMKRVERQAVIDEVIHLTRERMDEMGLSGDIDGRPKHFFSIYKKMYKEGKPFEEIYDLIAIRVVVESVKDCYAVLGAVHTLWKPMPGRFKDYISMPKPNMYQSLHTTVVGPKGIPFEVQIRTWDMHRLAEYGIAAHWRYKEGRQNEDELDQKLSWLRQILDWQSETKDSKEFMDTLKVDLFSDEVFVFTPKGDVVNLPAGANPIDFAYAIHSAVGNRCVGAKINGRIVTLDTALKTGDFVEIMTSSASKGPSMDWMKIATTSSAKSKIRQFYKREFREENVEKGCDMLEREMRRQGLDPAKLLKQDFIAVICRRYGFSSEDDVYAAVGFGGLSTGQVVTRLHEEQKKTEKPAAPLLPSGSGQRPHAAKPSSNSVGVRVAGESDMLVRFARCCTPVPGDDIVGYITRGRGVSVHRRDCVNVRDSNEGEGRYINVSWDDGTPTAYNVEIVIVAYDKVGLLAEISNLLASMDLYIESLSARANRKEKTSTLAMTLEIKDSAQLDKVMKSLARRPEIIDVRRMGETRE